MNKIMVLVGESWAKPAKPKNKKWRAKLVDFTSMWGHRNRSFGGHNSNVTMVYGTYDCSYWPFQDPKLEAPTIDKAFLAALIFREYPHNLWPYLV